MGQSNDEFQCFFLSFESKDLFNFYSSSKLQLPVRKLTSVFFIFLPIYHKLFEEKKPSKTLEVLFLLLGILFC